MTRQPHEPGEASSAVCDCCDQVVGIPQQSVPRIRAALQALGR